MINEVDFDYGWSDQWSSPKTPPGTLKSGLKKSLKLSLLGKEKNIFLQGWTREYSWNWNAFIQYSAFPVFLTPRYIDMLTAEARDRNIDLPIGGWAEPSVFSFYQRVCKTCLSKSWPCSSSQNKGALQRQSQCSNVNTTIGLDLLKYSKENSVNSTA